MFRVALIATTDVRGRKTRVFGSDEGEIAAFPNENSARTSITCEFMGTLYWNTKNATEATVRKSERGEVSGRRIVPPGSMIAPFADLQLSARSRPSLAERRTNVVSSLLYLTPSRPTSPPPPPPVLFTRRYRDSSVICEREALGSRHRGGWQLPRVCTGMKVVGSRVDRLVTYFYISAVCRRREGCRRRHPFVWQILRIARAGRLFRHPGFKSVSM